MLIKYKHKDKFGITGTVEVEGRLFVCKSKNGKDVFAGDKIRALIFDVSSKPLIGRIVPNKSPLSCWMFKYKFESKDYLAPAPDLKDIEIIEEKEDE